MEVNEAHVPRILTSFFYWRTRDLDDLIAKSFTQVKPDIFVDSGAFTAFRQSLVIDVNEYIEWVKKWKHVVTVYANLDVISSPKRTARNLDIIEAAGLKPLPIFHAGAPYRLFEELIDRYDYVAVGGVAKIHGKQNKMFKFLHRVFKASEGKAVLHAFGVTDIDFLKLFPWYSTDSSSWLSGIRYGRLRIWDPWRASFHTIILRQPKTVYRHRKVFEYYDQDWKQYAYPDKYSGPVQQMVEISVQSHKEMEMWLREKHGEVPYRGDVGIKVYLTNTVAMYMKDMDKVLITHFESKE